MKTTVIPWNHAEPASEQAIRKLLVDEGLASYAWSNAPGDVYGAHSHPYHKVLYVVRGSITFGLPGEGSKLELKPGDRLELPAKTVHDAVVGSQGVVCLEAHKG
jgi:quercetin dioxygenase-like cupin family protein